MIPHPCVWPSCQLGGLPEWTIEPNGYHPQCFRLSQQSMPEVIPPPPPPRKFDSIEEAIAYIVGERYVEMYPDTINFIRRGCKAA